MRDHAENDVSHPASVRNTRGQTVAKTKLPSRPNSSVSSQARACRQGQRRSFPANKQREADCRVRIGKHTFQVFDCLGQGSFGAVRRGTSEAGFEVAIKEISCSNHAEISRAFFEAQILHCLTCTFSSSHRSEQGGANQLPLLVAFDNETTHQSSQRIRLAMTRVPGRPLEDYLKDSRKTLSGTSLQFQLELASRSAGELLIQLAPTLDKFSAYVYHRDITPRNILIDVSDGVGDPRFGLVDFGLAVNAVHWRTQAVSSDLGGDGHYWPPSAWYVFTHGTHALVAQNNLLHEYRTCLDTHALGLSALRCLVEMSPSNLCASTEASSAANAALGKLQHLFKAWAQYWSHARRFWQPVFNAFKHGGDFRSLRQSYAALSVHKVISDDLNALHTALVDASKAWKRAPLELGVANIPCILDTLLLMVRPGVAHENAPMTHGDSEILLVGNTVQRANTLRESEISPEPPYLHELDASTNTPQSGNSESSLSPCTTYASSLVLTEN